MVQKHGFSNQGFSLCHLNICSIPAHLSELEAYLNYLSINFSVIAITETFLKEMNADLYGIAGYEHVFRCRSNKKQGGTSLFVKDNFTIKERRDLEINNDDIESQILEIEKSDLAQGKNIVIGVIYRPHGNCNEFVFYFKNLLDTIRSEHKICYFLGDFNVDLFKIDIHKPTSDFLDSMYSHLYIPLINRPTRVTQETSTLIDNIFTNNLNNKCNTVSGIFPINISDHYLIWHVSEMHMNMDKPKYFLRRQLGERNKQTFQNHLSAIDWTSVLEENDTQTAFSLFHSKYMTCYNKSFPVIKINFQYNNRKPWLSQSLRNSIRQKNKLYLKSEKVPTLSNIRAYKLSKTFLSKALVAAENTHLEQLFIMNQGNLTKTWNIIKGIINKNSSKKIQQSFVHGDNVIINKDDIAEHFNNFFINIGPNLNKNMSGPNGNVLEFMQRSKKSIFIMPTTPDEIVNIVKKLKPSSPGWDEIRSDILQLSMHTIVDPLCHICNLSLKHGIFPNELKLAKVIPIYKSGDPMYFVHYCPVSVLPVMSKVLEKLMYNRLYNFLQEMLTLYKNQFGFRPDHSTYMALILCIDKIISALENGDCVFGVFLDFSKAFDTIDHCILLKKLECYGIRGTALKWFESYLSNRYQYVYINGVSSTRQKIVCGVPQGSILGPLLFLIYVNDLANIVQELFKLMYADDSNLFLQGSDLPLMERTFNHGLAQISKWLKLNKLVLNIDKTYSILFRRRKQLLNYEPCIKIDDRPISRVSDTKFLGVYIDEHLIWKKHIQYIGNKIAKGIGILS